ncbi:immunoglobulin lambda-1 light chain-like [Limanda limanda]|uniref:immunoglobulin lambda-1 light chain-like n=1 Tax=Limanda limanda TaxID=27771 RepID=UPI0029C81DC5|nr:immunoglobulin lambda-1 light chain-like [Limanda limanda]
MLLLPAAALCCLCSALVAMAAEPTQDQLSLTRRVDEQASFSCGGTGQCNWIRWFQKKDTGTFIRILHIDTSDGQIRKGYNHPQKDDFTAEVKQNSCELKIEKVKLSHAATYYCACWRTAHLIFGSGTKLFVPDRPLVTPVVSVYPAASIAALDGKSSLLCVASNMVPPLVQFSWTRQREGGPLETLSSADGEQLELRGTGRTAAIMVVDQNAPYKYRCHVRHEGGTVEAPAEQVNWTSEDNTTSHMQLDVGRDARTWGLNQSCSSHGTGELLRSGLSRPPLKDKGRSSEDNYVHMLSREDRWSTPGVREAVYVKLEKPSLNRRSKANGPPTVHTETLSWTLGVNDSVSTGV